MIARAARAIDRARVAVAEADVLDLVPRLMLVFLLLKPSYPWHINVPLVVLAACGLLFPGLARSAGLWLVLALLTGSKLVADWAFVDNHLFVVTYWCLALACCLSLDAPRPALARSGRWLIGLVFGFALLWKVGLDQDFVSGRLFRDLLLTDPRFGDLSLMLGGMDRETQQRNLGVLAAVINGESSTGTLVEPRAHIVLARLAAWWTTLVEALVAATFLWPPGSRPSSARHALLLLFCWTTYTFGTVIGFGWMLMIMAIAQCEPERRHTRLLYLATFFLILVYARLPWSDTLLDLLGR